MADGAANDSAANDVVELEALGKDGLSWHPCQVSLCPRGLGLIVLYGNNKLEEMITDKKDIFARIRVRSTPLQGDDCLSIRQGEHVLATQNSHINGIFYDARVEQAIHVRHSKRSRCRCSFTIKWLHRALPEEALTVPASAIMKLETKSIHFHPTISALFSMQEFPDALDAMPCSMIADGKNWEMDINVLLEQQIKAISTSTDIPQENNLKDSVSGYKVDLQGQSHGCEIEASLKDSLGAIPFLDKLKETDGSENKQSIKLILETPPAPTPSIREELIGSRLLLNPLAARAALASLRSEFPQSPKVSARCNENGDMTGHHITVNLPRGSTFCSFSAVDCSLNGEDSSLKISATLEGESPNLRSIVKKLFPTSSPPHIVEKKTGEKKTALSAEMRLTRSKIKIGNGMHETSQMTNNNGTQLRLTDTRRVTRSRGRGAEKAEDIEYNAAVRDHELTEFTKLETFPQSTVVPQDYLSDNQRAVASLFNGQISTQRVTRSRVEGVEKTDINKYNAAVIDNVHTGCLKPGTNTQDTVAPKYGFAGSQKVVASPIDGDTSILFAKDERGILGEDGKVVDIDTQKVNLIQNAKKQNNPKRLTRSAASKDTENNNVQPKLKLRKRDLTESNECFAEEGENKKILTRVKTTPKSSESSVGGDKGTSKSATSKKQETRFSPRLRFLPRTRSQTKD